MCCLHNNCVVCITIMDSRDVNGDGGGDGDGGGGDSVMVLQ